MLSQGESKFAHTQNCHWENTKYFLVAKVDLGMDVISVVLGTYVEIDIIIPWALEEGINPRGVMLGKCRIKN